MAETDAKKKKKGDPSQKCNVCKTYPLSFLLQVSLGSTNPYGSPQSPATQAESFIFTTSMRESKLLGPLWLRQLAFIRAHMSSWTEQMTGKGGCLRK